MSDEQNVREDFEEMERRLVVWMTRARTRQADLDAALDLLEEMEWESGVQDETDEWIDACPWCQEPKMDHVHAPDCRWLALMRRTGRRE